MDNKVITRLIHRESAHIAQSLTAKDLLTSQQFAGYVRNLVEVTTKRYSNRIEIKLIHDETDDMTAATNGKSIIENTGNHLIMDFTAITNNFYAAVGMILHEVAHILYSDFDSEIVVTSMMEQGSLYGDSPVLAEQEDQDAYDEIKKALQTAPGRQVLLFAYHEIANAIADPHDEDCLIANHGQFVRSAIEVVRDALMRSIPSYESIKKIKEEPDLSVVFSFILQYARFQKIYMEFPGITGNDPIFSDFEKVKPVIDAARRSDDIFSRVSYINQILIFLWSYIKKEIKDQNEEQSGGSMSEEDAESILDQLGEAAKQSGQTTLPENGATNNVAKQKLAGEKNSDEQRTASKGDASSDEDMAQSIVDQLMKQIAKEEAESLVRDQIQEETLKEIEAVDQNGTHKGHSVTFRSPEPISQDDIAFYNQAYEPLRSYSKRLQRRFLEIIRDRMAGDVSHRRFSGNVFEAQNAYRPDQRFYGKKTLPEDSPNMVLTVLLDQSGSMHGKRIYSAMQSAILLQDFASALRIPVSVVGHHTTLKGISYNTWCDFESASKKDKYALAQLYTQGANRDGMAIEIAANRLSKRPEEIKLFIIISDGQPSDFDYGGKAAAKDIQQIVARYRRQGVEVIAAAIGEDKERIKEIYGLESFLDISDLEKLPKKLVSLVTKRLRY